jgi:hypothetical protein
MFANYLDNFMNCNGTPYVSLDWFRLSCMIFGDDIALVADSRDNHQKQLGIIKNYLEKEGFRVER